MSRIDEILRKFFDFYDEQIKQPFISFRNVLGHLWVPITSSLLGFVLFAWVPQTQDIYRSFIEDIQFNGDKVFLGTFLVFVLSCIVWYSGRLLSYRYSEDEKVAAVSETKFQVWCQQNQNNSIFSIVRQWKEIFQSDTQQKSQLLENLTLLYIPRIIGLLPFTGLMIGLKAICDEDPAFSLKIWLGVCALAWFGLFSLFCLRRRILNPSWTQTRADPNDSLFSSNAENFLANLGLFCFAALTLPLVASLSGKKSLGIVIFFVCCFALNYFLWKWNPIDPPQWRKRNLFNPVFLGGFVFISGLIFLNFPPLFWSNLLGSVSIAAISLCIFVVILSTIYNWGNEFGIPAVSGIIVIAIVASLAGLNNNHQIRTLSTESITTPVIKEDIASAFKTWFTNRPDIDAYAQEYPVYIVSAQGGGIYAAYHAAATLAQLHDTIPRFSDHIFAISGVSGGSVGSSVYASLVKAFGGPKIANQEINPCPSLSQCAKQVLSEDFLSPQFSLGLFPDLLQRFIPFAINDWDRSLGLEVAMQESWNKNINQDNDEIVNPLAEPFYDFWQAKGHSPALVLNTTNVETGKRLLMSPFTMTKVRTLLDYDTKQQSLALSTAAGLSARFPVISSAGWFKHQYQGKNYKVRLIDGGYVDNSGLATTQDIIAMLEQKQGANDMSVMDEIVEQSSPQKQLPQPRLISLAIVGQPGKEPLSSKSFQGLNELGSPLLGFWNVYGNRSNQVIEQARFELNREALNRPEGKSLNISDYRFRGIYLNANGLPLGWLLSNSSEKKIDAQIPLYDDNRCNDRTHEQIIEAIVQPIESSDTLLLNNACVARSIFEELNNSGK